MGRAYRDVRTVQIVTSRRHPHLRRFGIGALIGVGLAVLLATRGVFVVARISDLPRVIAGAI